MGALVLKVLQVEITPPRRGKAATIDLQGFAIQALAIAGVNPLVPDFFHPDDLRINFSRVMHLVAHVHQLLAYLNVVFHFRLQFSFLV